MVASATKPPSSLPTSGNPSVRKPEPTSLERLQHALEHASELLPAQGPITVFIHHNTLHALEHLSFEEGLEEGSRLYGCQPYLSEARYREELSRGRICRGDLEIVLQEDLGDEATLPVASLGTRFQLRLAMLEYPLTFGLAQELRWFVAETDALTQFRKDAPADLRKQHVDATKHWVMRNLRETKGDPLGSSQSADRRGLQLLSDLLTRFGRSSVESWSEATSESLSLQALWRVCSMGVHHADAGPGTAHPPRRQRDLLLEATSVDSDTLVNEMLIRFCVAFLDQGVAPWPLPCREQGFLASFTALYGKKGGPPDVWLRPLAAELTRIQKSGMTPLESIHESLQLLGIPETEWNDFLAATGLALRGWAGMIHQMELRADRVAIPAPAGSVVEFFAVRLLLDRLAVAYVASEELGYTGPLDKLLPAILSTLARREATQIDQRAFLVFQLAQVCGWHPSTLVRYGHRDWELLVAEVEAFNSLERRRLFHRAYECRFRQQTLDALAIHSAPQRGRVPTPRFQTICCLDEREESFRRHMEEICPETETFGAAGFFSVAMYYRGAANAHFVPLCPIVIRPQHWVVEDVGSEHEREHQRRAKTRKALGAASHHFHLGSRGLASGALLTAGLGVVASIPLVARVLFPRLTSLVRRSASKFFRPPNATLLRLERNDSTAGPENGHIGYRLDEMVNIAERLLRDIGLISGFARLIAFLGHGSNSLNNPHKSAYDCGACGGNAGGPNARAAARILNDPRVRDLLIERGILIPEETWFVGGFHNTCDDSVTFLDEDKIPQSHQDDFVAFQQVVEQTCDRNAHERCRRFQSAPLNLSFTAARRHVQARSEDLAQTRPECGHASNAICIVGRRERTRGLYMDRRAFLTSYDPTQDDAEAAILTRVLGAVVPVCGGINLEYYFSYVDSPGWGCGTKLPHNISSLLGVMDGAASDLRTGLPWQMVEIHEPVRLLIVVETTPEILAGIMDRNLGIGTPCRNGWVQMATLDPESNEIHLLGPNGFELYRPTTNRLLKAPSSTDWYRGWRDNLGFAVIDPQSNGGH